MSEDAITLLENQHDQMRRRFATVESGSGPARNEAFRELVKLISVHETAEEELVHPEVRTQPGGEPVAEARIGEERRIKHLMSTLDGLGPEAEGLDTLLQQLREDVLAHAEHEEREEFPILRRAAGPKRLEAMADKVRAAEAVAPTRPHPGMESAAANMALSAPASIIDRARDAIRATLHRGH